MNTQTNTTLTALEKTEETLEEVEAAQGVDFENLIRSSLGEGVRWSIGDDQITKRLKTASHILSKSGYLTLKPLLPLLLEIRGKLYHLHDHFPFSPFFRTRMPRRTLLKTGRQVSKSTSLAAQGVLFSNCITVPVHSGSFWFRFMPVRFMRFVSVPRVSCHVYKTGGEWVIRMPIADT